MEPDRDSLVRETLCELATDIDEAQRLLFELVYDELRQLAHRHMRSERREHTLQTTALVNEAYLRLSRSPPAWENPGHFFAAASEAMRRILIEHARHVDARDRAERERLERLRVEGSASGAATHFADDLIALDAALSRLERALPRQGLVVKLRYFGGRSVKETAAALGISPRTVDYDWNLAKAWLLREIEVMSARADAERHAGST